ncbi:ATP-binding protein [Streptomyces sp. NPDC056831]|uniref:ATP-binding protein n=1 Tax=Streptomyces sp. NPDC056831 TaxID=3345954 RepID=UPI003694F112
MTLMAETVTEAAPGFYLMTKDRGFAVHISASADHLHLVRELAGKTLAEAGVGSATAENVQLVASELVGNAVRACGDLVPLVVEVETDAAEGGVWVRVHDPDPVQMPERSGVAMDDPTAVSGRGLSLIDFLAPGWDVALTSIGKQVRARLPYADG